MKRFLPLSEMLKIKEPVFIEIRGRNTVLAEGYCRIDAYSDSVIVLASAESRIAVRGSELVLKHLSSGRIAVEGEIIGVEFL